MRYLITFLAFIAVFLTTNAQSPKLDFDGHLFEVLKLKGRQVLAVTSNASGETRVLPIEAGTTSIDSLKILGDHQIEVSYTSAEGKHKKVAFLNRSEWIRSVAAPDQQQVQVICKWPGFDR